MIKLNFLSLRRWRFRSLLSFDRIVVVCIFCMSVDWMRGATDAVWHFYVDTRREHSAICREHYINTREFLHVISNEYYDVYNYNETSICKRRRKYVVQCINFNYTIFAFISDRGGVGIFILHSNTRSAIVKIPMGKFFF